jgi:hypothetical protein
MNSLKKWVRKNYSMTYYVLTAKTMERDIAVGWLTAVSCEVAGSILNGYWNFSLI